MTADEALATIPADEPTPLLDGDAATDYLRRSAALWERRRGWAAMLAWLSLVEDAATAANCRTWQTRARAVRAEVLRSAMTGGETE